MNDWRDDMLSKISRTPGMSRGFSFGESRTFECPLLALSGQSLALFLIVPNIGYLPPKPSDTHEMHLVAVGSACRRGLPRSTTAELENQEALQGIENSEVHEIRQIQAALNRELPQTGLLFEISGQRISEGTYGICTLCGA